MSTNHSPGAYAAGQQSSTLDNQAAVFTPGGYGAPANAGGYAAPAIGQHLH